MQVQTRDELVATVAYRPEPVAAAAARRFIRDTLRSWPLAGRPARRDALIDDAVLLTSELVTNAVVHAGTRVEVTCKLSAVAVEVVVLDERPAQLIPDLPQALADPGERTSGRGLQLPSELASAWGVTYARAAKAIWFRIGLSGSPQDHQEPVRYAEPDLAAMMARTAASVPDADVPAWARRNLSRLGYEELLSSTAEAGRAATGAEIAYLLDAGEDGELRVRAVADTGQPWQAPGSVTWSAARALAGAALSLMTIPLVVDGRVTGVLAVAAAESGRFGEHDATRLQELADRVAPELERARLGELEQGRQEQAEFLAQAAGELSVTLDPEKTAAVGARLAAGSLAAWCAVLATGQDGALRLLSVAHADPSLVPELEWLLERAEPPQAVPTVHRDRHMPGWRWHLDLPAPAGGGGRHRSDGPRARQEAADSVPPGVPELATAQAWCFPLEVAGRVLGLLAIGAPGQRWPVRDARELAAGLARRVAVALDNVTRHTSTQFTVPAPDPGAHADQAQPDQARADQALPDQGRAYQAQTHQAQTRQAQTRQAQTDQAQPDQARSVPTQRSQEHSDQEQPSQ